MTAANANEAARKGKQNALVVKRYKLNNEYSPHERSFLRRAIHVLSIITHRQAFTISLLPVTSKKEPKKQSFAGFGRTAAEMPRPRGDVASCTPTGRRTIGASAKGRDPAEFSIEKGRRRP